VKNLSRENALLLVYDLFLRERMDLKDWNLRQMSSNLQQIKRILEDAKWERSELSLTNDFSKSLEELELVISNRDATRVDAAHTHVEEALAKLRENVFGV